MLAAVVHAPDRGSGNKLPGRLDNSLTVFMVQIINIARIGVALNCELPGACNQVARSQQYRLSEACDVGFTVV